MNTSGVTYDSINLDRLLHSTPPLPTWVVSGLLGRDGIFRGGFVIVVPPNEIEYNTFNGAVTQLAESRPRIDEAAGPGLLWVSPAETEQLLQQLKRDKSGPDSPHAANGIFSPRRRPRKRIAPFGSPKRGSSSRWGSMGPGHKDPASSQAFLAPVSAGASEAGDRCALYRLLRLWLWGDGGQTGSLPGRRRWPG